MNNKVRCLRQLHSDFSLEWDTNFEGSISTSKLLQGMVIMKYSSIPYFIHILSKSFNNFDFLGEKMKEEILNCEEVSFAGCSYRNISHRVESDAEYFGSMWRGVFKDRNTREKRKIEEERLKILRHNFDISNLIEDLNSKGIDHETLNYAGVVPPSSEYPRLVHILLSPKKETYISQYWQEMNILKTNEEQTKKIVSDTVKLYGVVVSGALRNLLEKI